MKYKIYTHDILHAVAKHGIQLDMVLEQLLRDNPQLERVRIEPLIENA
jgi:hypothetical protein